MDQKRFPQWAVVGILVALFFGVALYLRVALPYDKVFVGDWVKFTGVDAYFHMRIVDNLVNNFPHLNSFDPYMLWPIGRPIDIRPFFAYLIAGLSWLVGLGSPTQHTIDAVGVYFPAILGALTVIPVYFIGKALFNRWVGVIAAGLVGIFPGEFLGRSLLGFTDNHVAEVLFSTVTMLFFILAVKSAKRAEFDFSNFKSWNWGTIGRPLIYSLLTGIFLGIYILSWQGALLFVFIIFACIIVLFLIDHFRSKSTAYLSLTSTVTFGIALLMFLPVLRDRLTLLALTVALVIPIALAALSHFMTSRNMRPVLYLVTIVGVGLVSIAVVYGISPALLRFMVGRFGIFTWNTTTTIYEMQPLLLPMGSFSLSVVWLNLTTSAFLSFIALGILIYFVVKHAESDKVLFVVWSLVMLAATLSMRRFVYYFVVNAALLTGYLSWLILEFSGFRKPAVEPSAVVKDMKQKGKQKKKRREGSRSGASRVNMALGVIIVFFLVFYPNIGPWPGGAKPAIDVASNPQFAPSDAWCEALSWLENETPEPFGDANFYYELYEPPPPGERYDYPQTAYGVTAWWDYGYWIIRSGRRIPSSTPGTSHKGEAHVFAAQDEASANKVLLEKWGSKYVIVDYATAMPIGGKFHAVAKLSRSSLDKFFDIYYEPQGATARPVPVYYPEYYRTLLVRLYNFDGREIIPRRCTVISFEERLTREGERYKEITDVKTFPTYSEAEAYIAGQTSGKHRIVGTDPFASPVPLEALGHYKLVYSSKGSKMQPSGSLVPEVKIFQYVE